jgi:hypothetical protein
MLVLVVKFEQKHVHGITIWTVSVAHCWSNRLGIERNLVRAQRVLSIFLKTWRMERNITLVRFFREALCHICVTAEA